MEGQPENAIEATQHNKDKVKRIGWQYCDLECGYILNMVAIYVHLSSVQGHVATGLVS